MRSPAVARFGAVLLTSTVICTPDWESHAVPPIISGLSLAGTSLRINVTSDVGITNQIQTITDLDSGNWSVLTNLMVSQSNYWFEETVTGSQSLRFYRVLALPASNPNPGAPADMVLIPAGTFEMGDTFYEGATYELPVHSVYVSAVYMDKFEVSKGLWDRVKTWS